MNDPVFVQLKKAQNRNAKKKNGNRKDVLVSSDDSRVLHRKDAFARETENDDEDEFFSSSELTWDLVAEVSGVNEDKLRRKKMTLKRRAAAGRKAQEGLSSAIVDDLPEEDPHRDVLEEENGDEMMKIMTIAPRRNWIVMFVMKMR